MGQLVYSLITPFGCSPARTGTTPKAMKTITPHRISSDCLHPFILRLLSRHAGQLNGRLQTSRAYGTLTTPTLSMLIPSGFAPPNRLPTVPCASDAQCAVSPLTAALSWLRGDTSAIPPLSRGPEDRG